MADSAYYIGLMSGTSLDGVDAALVDFGAHPRLVATHYIRFDEEIRSGLLALHAPGFSELDQASALSLQLAEHYANAVFGVLRKTPIGPLDVRAIGCHGQTIRHRPEKGYTIQLNQPSVLAERTGITVVADFRSRDIAAGGQGAPLVPAFHRAVFTHPTLARVVVNIGGIANITRLPPSRMTEDTVIGFDTGPGNLLMDCWTQSNMGCQYDAGGKLAASGHVVPELLSRMLADGYFRTAPPKSTGRDHFNAEWIEQFRPSCHPAADVLATLAELTALSIASGIRDWSPGTQEIHICGGGAHNHHLMGRIRHAMAPIPVETTLALGADPDWVEAMAFAWLARQTMQNRPGNLPEVTGAAGLRILGAIHPA